RLAHAFEEASDDSAGGIVDQIGHTIGHVDVTGIARVSTWLNDTPRVTAWASAMPKAPDWLTRPIARPAGDGTGVMSIKVIAAPTSALTMPTVFGPNSAMPLCCAIAARRFCSALRSALPVSA